MTVRDMLIEMLELNQLNTVFSELKKEGIPKVRVINTDLYPPRTYLLHLVHASYSLNSIETVLYYISLFYSVKCKSNLESISALIRRNIDDLGISDFLDSEEIDISKLLLLLDETVSKIEESASIELEQKFVALVALFVMTL